MSKNILGSVIILLASLLTVKGFAQDQRAADDKILTEYFAKNHIKATKTASGLYYVITKKGSGTNAKAGDQVNMNYLGKFLDGKKFDGNVDENYNVTRQVLTFTLGRGQVIKGWDEGIQLLNPGTRATLYIPSTLGYGAMARGPIPANSILVFNVELLSIDN